jgi:hypothetical protein
MLLNLGIGSAIKDSPCGFIRFGVSVPDVLDEQGIAYLREQIEPLPSDILITLKKARAKRK